MAKCLKNIETGEIKRLSENNRKEQSSIINMVNSGSWIYIPKSEWKKTRPEPKKNKNEKTSNPEKTKRDKKSE